MPTSVPLINEIKRCTVCPRSFSKKILILCCFSDLFFNDSVCYQWFDQKKKSASLFLLNIEYENSHLGGYLLHYNRTKFPVRGWIISAFWVLLCSNRSNFLSLVPVGIQKLFLIGGLILRQLFKIFFFHNLTHNNVNSTIWKIIYCMSIWNSRDTFLGIICFSGYICTKKRRSI